MAAWGLLGALLLGFVAGLRTLTAPAALFFVRGDFAGKVLAVFAVGEYIGDLLPQIPSRTSPPALFGRIASGAVCGWIFAAGAGAPGAAGAVCGMVGAVLGAFGGRAVRVAAIERFGAIPAALVEDAVAIALAVYVVTRPA